MQTQCCILIRLNANIRDQSGTPILSSKFGIFFSEPLMSIVSKIEKTRLNFSLELKKMEVPFGGVYFSNLKLQLHLAAGYNLVKWLIS